MSSRENALVVCENSPRERQPSSSGLHKSPSFAQSDLVVYRRAFQASDQNKCGSILAVDILHVANRLGYKISSNQLKDILSGNNLDESSLVNFELFLDLLPRNKCQISDEEHQEAESTEKFHKCDKDGKGFVSLVEVQSVLQSELGLSSTNSLNLLNRFIRLDLNQFFDFYKQVQDKKLEIYKSFGRFDADKDSFVSVSEAHDILKRELGFNEERSRKMVERFDLDKDGFLSYVEFGDFYIAFEENRAKVRQAFEEFDEDRVGFATNCRAANILSGILGFSEERSIEIVEKYDMNKDGKIDFEEFIDFYSMIEQETEKIVREFKLFDQDNDGMINESDFKKTLEKRGQTKDDVDGLLSNLKIDAGFISFSEFKRYLNGHDCTKKSLV